MGRMGLNGKRASVFFAVYQSHFLEAAVAPNALFKTLLSLALGAVCGGRGGEGGLPSPTGVCPPLLVTHNALITKPKAGDVCLLGPEGS